jgi:hypothetical protein
MSEFSIAEGLIGSGLAILSAAFGVVWKRQDRHEDDTRRAHAELREDIDEQRDKLSGHREAIARDYITKADFVRLEAKIDDLGKTLRGAKA